MSSRKKNSITLRSDSDATLADILFSDNEKASDLLHTFKKYFNVELYPSENDGKLKIKGTVENNSVAKKAFYSLSAMVNTGKPISNQVIESLAKDEFKLSSFPADEGLVANSNEFNEIAKNGQDKRKNQTLKKDQRNHPEKYVQFVIEVEPKTENQGKFLDTVPENDVTFGVGPAGTGKTFLAVFEAVKAFQRGEVSKIFLSRPAVGNGKDLGALPGDIGEKLAPYLRPLYDELDKLIGHDMLEKLMEKGIIEIAPLEFMRGRTFSDAFVILDEAQNTNQEQMKMALTRLGEGSKMVVTGDPRQVDLREASGLSWAQERLEGVEGIGVQKFTTKDVVRSKVVGRIIDALEKVPDAPEVKKKVIPSAPNK